MKFALIDGKREEAKPNTSGKCLACDHPMIAKCGEVKVWHWAHKAAPPCDSWWEGETEWHRQWKGKFPAEWQEVFHQAESGEKHIADVKTTNDWVIEFQHSFLKPEERRSRDAFYNKLIWVVDGVRRKRDKSQFMRAWNEGTQAGQNSTVRKVFSSECAILREWAECKCHVFFDFGDDEFLWWRFAKGSGDTFYIHQLPQKIFVDLHYGNLEKAERDTFGEAVKNFIAQVSQYETESQKRSMVQLSRSLQRPPTRQRRTPRF